MGYMHTSISIPLIIAVNQLPGRGWRGAIYQYLAVSVVSTTQCPPQRDSLVIWHGTSIEPTQLKALQDFVVFVMQSSVRRILVTNQGHHTKLL